MHDYDEPVASVLETAPSAVLESCVPFELFDFLSPGEDTVAALQSLSFAAPFSRIRASAAASFPFVSSNSCFKALI